MSTEEQHEPRAPTQLVFIISLVIALIGVLAALNVVTFVAIPSVWIVTIAYVVLVAGLPYPRRLTASNRGQPEASGPRPGAFCLSGACYPPAILAPDGQCRRRATPFSCLAERFRDRAARAIGRLRGSGQRTDRLPRDAPGHFRQIEPASLTIPLVISFGDPFAIGLGRPPGDNDRFGSFTAGLFAGPVTIDSFGTSHCLQIDFTPLGARRFFGMPMSELTDRMVGLDDVLGASRNGAQRTTRRRAGLEPAASISPRPSSLQGWPPRPRLPARSNGHSTGSPRAAAARR